jgi:oligopeptide transport system permease protein
MPDRSQGQMCASPSSAPHGGRTPGGRASEDGLRRSCRKRFQPNRLTLLAALLLALGILLLLAWPVWQHPGIAQFLPTAITRSPAVPTEAIHQPPNAQNWFGTDLHGRDVLSRVVQGGRLTLLFGILVTGLSLLFGVTWGVTAVASGGRWDVFLERLGVVLRSAPLLVFLIALISWWQGPWPGGTDQVEGLLAGLTGNLLRFALVLSLLLSPLMACEFRDRIVALRQSGPVEAACLLGVSPSRILRRHLLPELRGAVMLWLVRTLPVVILYETFLTFAGLGVQAPGVSLGTLLAEGAQGFHPERDWWLVAFPGGILMALLITCQGLAMGLAAARGSPRRG